MTESAPTPDVAAPGSTTPGSTTDQHPHDGIPYPGHGIETLDELSVHDLAAVPADLLLQQVALLLVSAAGEKLGLAPDGEPNLDLPGARALIDALAALLAASGDLLGDHGQPLLDGLRTLQAAFRETSARPDPPGQGPGERFLP